MDGEDLLTLHHKELQFRCQQMYVKREIQHSCCRCDSEEKCKLREIAQSLAISGLHNEYHNLCMTTTVCLKLLKALDLLHTIGQLCQG